MSTVKVDLVVKVLYIGTVLRLSITMADEILSVSVRDGINIVGVRDGINDVGVQVTGAVLIDAMIEGAIVFDGAVDLFAQLPSLC